MSPPRAPTALVTGSASGLGAATVAALADRGFVVAGLDLTESPRCPHHACADVADRDALDAAIGGLVTALGGRLDVVVNAAGAVLDAVTPVGDLDGEVLGRTIEVNLLGAVNVCRATLPALTAHGGAIVLVASCVARSPQVGASAYAMAKAGVVSLARSIAIEYGAVGVRANSVSPGFMDTPMAAPVLGVPARRHRVEQSIPTGHVADPGEVASLIAWLATDAHALSGEDILIDGAQRHTAYSTTDDARRLREWRAEHVGAAGAP